MLVLITLLGHLKLCHRVLEPRNSSPEPPVFGLQRYQRILHRGDAAGLRGDLPRRKQIFLRLPAREQDPVMRVPSAGDARRKKKINGKLDPKLTRGGRCDVQSTCRGVGEETGRARERRQGG